MNKEIKKTQIQAKREFSTILKKILEKRQVSEECQHCPTDNPLFETTCDYVHLRYELFTLAETLSQMADYQEMLLDE